MPRQSSRSSRFPWKRLALLALLTGLSFAIWARLRHSTTGDAPAAASLLPPLPQDPYIRVAFNHSESNRYTDPYRQIERLGDDLEAEIIGAIASAQTGINVAIQELRLPGIAVALIERHRAGIPVRVILEDSYNESWQELTARRSDLDDRARSRYDELTRLLDIDADGSVTPDEIAQRDAIAMLRAAGVPTIDDTADGSKGSGLMHHKFVAVDGRRSIVASANFSLSGTHGDLDRFGSRGNANNLLAIDSPELTALLDGEFAQMWGDGVGGEPDSRFGVKKADRGISNLEIGSSLVSVRFSPSSAWIEEAATTNGLIAAAIARAKRRIDIALFVFSSQPIADALRIRNRGGIEVRALIDPQFAFRDYSEGLDMLGVTLPNENCKIEDGNAPWQTPIASVGTPDLTPGDVLHHKFAAIDDRLVITGSHNWSNAANRNNDELVLVIQNPTVAAHFSREFDRLYRNARLGLPERIADRIAANPCP
ncbi:MAG: phospholipase D-like domain-containing protein [Geitlerinemataceae cyanobacterium]